jgi:hypothetical protein
LLRLGAGLLGCEYFSMELFHFAQQITPVKNQSIIQKFKKDHIIDIGVL